MEGTSDYDLAMEWYLKYGERGVVFKMGTVGGGEQILWENEYLKIVLHQRCAKQQK